MVSNGARRVATRIGWVLAAVAVFSVSAACGGDESAQERYCAAGEALRSDILALQDLDLVGEDADGLESALDTIDDDLDEMREAARDSAADEIEALQSAVTDVEDAVSRLGEQLSTDNVQGLTDAILGVAGAAQDVYATLSDC